MRFGTYLLLMCAWLACAAPARAYETVLEEWRGERTPEAADVRTRPDAEWRAVGPLPVNLGPDAERMRWWRLRPLESWQQTSPPQASLYAPYTNRIVVLAPPDYVPRRLLLREPDPLPQSSRHALRVLLPADWHAGQPVYFGFEPGRRFPARLVVESEAQWRAGDVVYLRTMTAMLAVMAVMALITAIFGLVLRERDFGILAVTLLCQWAFIALLTGEAYALPFGAWLAEHGVRPIWIVRALGEAGLACFTVVFLDVSRDRPWLARTLLAMAGAFGLIALASVPEVASQWLILPRLGNWLIAATSILIAIAAVLSLRTRPRAARFFLAAWLPLLALDMLRELQLAGLAGVYPGNEYALPFAGAMAASLFAFGLADRLLAVRRERDAARHAALQDPLTGVLNRAGVTARLVTASADTAMDHVAVLYLDLDHFKLINDTHGHAVGDACLIAVTRVADGELRPQDAIGRHGGEEFLIVMPGADAAAAAALAERIRAAVERLCAVVDDRAVGLTVSIGVAAAPTGIAPEVLIASADAALYAAKRAGRNRVRGALDSTRRDRLNV